MRFTMTLLFAIVVSACTLAVSQPDPGDGHTSPPRGRRQFMEKLGLDEKQKAEIAGLRTEMQKSMVGIQSKIKIARIDLRTMVAADSPDKAAIEGKMKEINDLQFQSKKLIVDHVFAVYGLLNPEQKKKFKDQMMMRLSGWRRPMGHGWQGSHRGMPDDNVPR